MIDLAQASPVNDNQVGAPSGPTGSAPLIEALPEWVVLGLFGTIGLLILTLIGLRLYLLWRDRASRNNSH